MFILRFRRGEPDYSLLRRSEEPAGDVHVEESNGWRTIRASKWMPSNVRYWVAQDLRAPVANAARMIGDYDFNLQWKIGDLDSVNRALVAYGLEVGEVKGDIHQ